MKVHLLEQLHSLIGVSSISYFNSIRCPLNLQQNQRLCLQVVVYSHVKLLLIKHNPMLAQLSFTGTSCLDMQQKHVFFFVYL